MSSPQTNPSSGISSESIVKKVLASMDIHSYDPLVVPMLVEYLCRTVEDILTSSASIAEFSGKDKIAIKDVKAAMDITSEDLQDGYLPSRNEMCELASIFNSQPLPARLSLDNMKKNLLSSIDNNASLTSIKKKGNKKVKLNLPDKNSSNSKTSSFPETSTLMLPPAPDSLINHNILFLSSYHVQEIERRLNPIQKGGLRNNPNAPGGVGKGVSL